MASFNYGNATRAVAVIDEETKSAVAGQGINASLTDNQRNYLDKASKGLLALAEELMDTLKNNDMSPSSATRDGTPYTPKLVITAVPARLYNSETKERDIPKLDDNGRQLVTLKIKIPNQTDNINLYADTNISDGIKLSNFSVSQWQKNEEGKNLQKTYARHELETAPLHPSTKNIVQHICDITPSLERHDTVAYIDKDSREAMAGKSHTQLTDEQRSFIKAKGNELLQKAEEIMSDLVEHNLTPTNKNKDGVDYSTKAVVTALPAYDYNKETGESDIPVLKKDKSPVFTLRITISNDNEDIILHSNESGRITSLSASRWELNEQTGKEAPRSYKGSELDSFTEATNSIAAYIKSNYVDTPLQALAYEYNQQLKQTTEKVFNHESKLVNDAYAKYESSEYGEKVQLCSHSSKVVVELGESKDGKRFAKAIDFGAPKNENNTYPYAFINNAQDLADIVAEHGFDKDLAAFVAEYKGFDFDRDKVNDKTAPVVEQQAATAPVQTASAPEIPPLKELADKLNVEYKAAGGKSYANYEDKYNRLVIYNRDNNLAVALGTTKKGDAYVTATNFAKTDENGKPITKFVNNAKDAMELIPVREIAEIAADYKGFNLDEKGASRPSNSKNNMDDVQR